MKTVLVRYKTHAGQAGENEELIGAVFAELRARKPAGFRYGAFKLADGVSFVHFALIDTPNASNPLLALDSFERFQRDLDGRCAEAPVVVDLAAVDEYGFGFSTE